MVENEVKLLKIQVLIKMHRMKRCRETLNNLQTVQLLKYYCGSAQRHVAQSTSFCINTQPRLR